VAEDEEGLEGLSQYEIHGKVDKTVPMERTIFAAEQQSQKDEFMLVCVCFFQDLQDVRCFWQDIWQKYEQK
jgi:hypothetical protein